MVNVKGAGKHKKLPNRKNRKGKKFKKYNRKGRRYKNHNNQLALQETKNNLFMNLNYDILSCVLDFSKDSKNSKISQNV